MSTDAVRNIKVYFGSNTLDIEVPNESDAIVKYTSDKGSLKEINFESYKSFIEIEDVEEGYSDGK